MIATFVSVDAEEPDGNPEPPGADSVKVRPVGQVDEMTMMTMKSTSTKTPPREGFLVGREGFLIGREGFL